jgi:hypothetical protein
MVNFPRTASVHNLSAILIVERLIDYRGVRIRSHNILRVQIGFCLFFCLIGFCSFLVADRIGFIFATAGYVSDTPAKTQIDPPLYFFRHLLHNYGSDFGILRRHKISIKLFFADIYNRLF